MTGFSNAEEIAIDAVKVRYKYFIYEIRKIQAVYLLYYREFRSC